MSLVILIGCCSKEEDPKVLFLENVMFQNQGIFVLMGSKPISTFPIENGCPVNKEEFAKFYEENLKGLQGSYHQFEKSYLMNKRRHTRFLWEEWKKNMPISAKYQFRARKAPFGRKSLEGLFINVPNTLFILNHHKALFEEIAGFAFDPESILEDIEDENSVFWNRVMEDDRTKGLIFGYGERNAFMFDWHAKRNLKPYWNPGFEMEDFSLPPISIYSLGDDSLNRYQREKEAIMKALKGKNKISLILQWLNS